MCCVPGTSPEGVDIRDYMEVGVTNMAVTTGLTLHDGQTYYVTVRGGWSVMSCNHVWLSILNVRLNSFMNLLVGVVHIF